nr:immunoglobulin light chain junction region [Macaca mulatta]MPO03283.1 immunoglobulin light chain junction region [Macaca mulatta]MPO03445.1 immunoglobulin light chain junction region [Macaca mulatta]MPO03641.1 immunoglobulin light chain junction region [Macaca mulatta]MPO03780.1 immunoglobulin light chain junction region [Macaca mulatta]
CSAWDSSLITHLF